ncbi:hypothetical protein G3N59_01050 [Paraburkholderia sp. Ac-20340]|uniref:hypothetical protein n=1 Tax=Paraburkholderia sp. Ac-20340 TaxID=2703888 RepID=UPI0019820DBF|nr:hypothetical protein [Paraburkholderia sp. Ac-20340]MBN3851954.1 hypothetical protein [Paraburkholderia sp. Ac-20340]
MNKFYDKNIAALVGHELALEVALKGAESSAAFESFDAIRKAQGLPSIHDEDREYLQTIRDDVAEGFEYLHDPLSVAEACGRPVTEEVRAASDRFHGR